MFKIIFLIFIILLLFYFYSKIKIENFTTQLKKNKCNYNHLILDKDGLHNTRDLLLTFMEFSEEFQIDYFAIGGTLIGTVRNGGLLPFDDDIDLGILINDSDKIKKYVIDDIYYKDEYYFIDFIFGYKLHKKNSNMFLDIMVFENKDDQYKIINDCYDNESFNLDEVNPIVKLPFDNIMINVPNKYKKYLDRAFKDWDKIIKMDCGHHYDGCFIDKNNIPDEIPLDYDNSKYNCYSSLTYLDEFYEN